jgi:hypothetical protein
MKFCHLQELQIIMSSEKAKHRNASTICSVVSGSFWKSWPEYKIVTSGGGEWGGASREKKADLITAHLIHVLKYHAGPHK